jgi:hypothetical protein
MFCCGSVAYCAIILSIAAKDEMQMASSNRQRIIDTGFSSIDKEMQSDYNAVISTGNFPLKELIMNSPAIHVKAGETFEILLTSLWINAARRPV